MGDIEGPRKWGGERGEVKWGNQRYIVEELAGTVVSRVPLIVGPRREAQGRRRGTIRVVQENQQSFLTVQFGPSVPCPPLKIDRLIMAAVY